MNSEIFRDEWIKHPVDIGNGDYPSWHIRDGRSILEEIRAAEDTGLSVEYLLSLIDFAAVDFSLKAEEAPKKEKKTSGSIEDEIKKLNRSYLRKLKTLDLEGSYLNSNQDFSKAIALLKKCV
jgi:hypothetical protein